jgi:hypothetical protein
MSYPTADQRRNLQRAPEWFLWGAQQDATIWATMERTTAQVVDWLRTDPLPDFGQTWWTDAELAFIRRWAGRA